MKPPTRLLDDASLDPGLRAELEGEQAREIAFDVDAGLARLEHAIETDLPAPDAAEIASGKLATAITAGVVGAGVALGIAWQLARTDPAPVPPPPVSAPVVVAPTARAPELAPPPPEPALPAPPPSASASAPAPPRSAPPVASAPSPKQRLAEEVRHLAETRRVAAGNPVAGARMADEGHARFRGGMLYQEREAVAITSLARAGRQGEARARALRFVERFPNSPFAEQVRTATGIAP